MLEVAQPLPLPRLRHCVIACLCSGIGWVSVRGSYAWYTSPPWIKAFGANGWWIELWRLVIGLAVTLFLIGAVFKAESEELLTVRPQPDSSARTRQVRWAFAVLLAGSLVLLVLQHVWWGPAELYAKSSGAVPVGSPWLHKDEARRAYLVPYLWYAGYSMINMIMILFVVTAVALSGSIRDVRRVWDSCRAFSGLKPGAVPDDTVQEWLLQAANRLRDHCRRACYLLGGVLILIIYENYLGWNTLSDGGKRFALVGYVIMSLSALLVAFSHSAYETAYSSANDALGNRAQQKLKGLSPFQVWSKARTSFPIVFAIVAVGALLAKQWVLPVFKASTPP